MSKAEPMAPAQGAPLHADGHYPGERLKWSQSPAKHRPTPRQRKPRRRG